MSQRTDEAQPHAAGPDPALAPVVDWLRGRNPELDAVPRDLDLIETRVIDSLSFMEFVLLLEDLVGHELDLQTLTVDQFRTLDAIQAAFLTPPRAP